MHCTGRGPDVGLRASRGFYARAARAGPNVLRRSGRIDPRQLRPLQPGLLPEDQAPHLAATVCLAITPHILQEHGIVHSPPAGAVCCVTQLVSTLAHTELLAAVLEHLGHQW